MDSEADGRSTALEAGHVEALRKAVDRLRVEVEELRASRKRLLLAAAADRRRFEGDLHDGVQQHLVALAVNLQLAGQLAESDPGTAQTLLAEMGGDVQQALEEAARLAEQIHPPLLEAGGLAVALRSASASAGVSASVEVTSSARHPPEVAAAVYACCREALQLAGTGTQASITVRDEGALVFEVVNNGDHSAVELRRLRDGVEALGGRLTVTPEPGGRTHVSGSIPLGSE